MFCSLIPFLCRGEEEQEVYVNVICLSHVNRENRDAQTLKPATKQAIQQFKAQTPNPFEVINETNATAAAPVPAAAAAAAAFVR